jgi:hypothetical protein
MRWTLKEILEGERAQTPVTDHKGKKFETKCLCEYLPPGKELQLQMASFFSLNSPYHAQTKDESRWDIP